MSDDQNLLTIRGVETYYGKIVALRGVDVDVKRGEIVTLIGANGAGKSTLMMTICGSPRARTGEIIFDGHADARDHPNGHRPVAGRPADLRPDDGDGKSPDGRAAG